jgi:hypothetical protein
MSASIRAPSRAGSWIFGTLNNRDVAALFASANAVRNQSTTSEGSAGQEDISPPYPLPQCLTRPTTHFAARWGKAKNRSSPETRNIPTATNPIGPDNMYFIKTAAAMSDKTICAWGKAWNIRTPLAAAKNSSSPTLPTGELAELHAVIRANAYERGAVETEAAAYSAPVKTDG